MVEQEAQRLADLICGCATREQNRKDVAEIKAIVAKNESRHLEYHEGRAFVIRHGGITDNGYNLGWNVFPGFGGAPDSYFTKWKPLDLPPPPEKA